MPSQGLKSNKENDSCIIDYLTGSIDIRQFMMFKAEILHSESSKKTNSRPLLIWLLGGRLLTLKPPPQFVKCNSYGDIDPVIHAA